MALLAIARYHYHPAEIAEVSLASNRLLWINGFDMSEAHTRRVATLATLCAVVAVGAATASAADVLVVCPAEFRPALAPWTIYREEQGHKLLAIEPPPTASELRAAIRRIAAENQLHYVVLVGDVEHARTNASTVPTGYAQAQVNIRWGSEPTIATDQLYADLDDDRIPDVAVGRIPAHTPAELSAVVRKVLNFEQRADEGMWRRKVDIVAGVGGFGAMTDALVEAAGRSVIQQTVPASYDVRPTFASPTNPASPPPDQFTPHVCRQLSAGSFAWIYLGHGLPTQLDSIQTSSGDRPVLSVDDVPQLQCGPNAPLAVLIACYTGAIDAPQECLAERLVLHERGPIAAIAATRVTMPYGNAVFGCELLRACFRDHPSTLGELWKTAQVRSLADAPDDSLRKSLDALASSLSPPPVDLAAERREHVLMYQFYGDPLTRLQFPRELQLNVASEFAGHESLTIDGTSAVAGECTIELVSKHPATPDQAVIGTAHASIHTGPFHITIALPPDAKGSYMVRGFVAGQSEFALGATTITLPSENWPTISRATREDVPR
jgi:Peptidase family C25